MTGSSKIYLAGPEVFLPDAIAIGARKKELCRKYGFTGLFPFDNEVGPEADRVDRLIFRANVELIEQSDLGICNLTPFRGVSADVGTVFELGLLTGLGKPTFGYSNVADDLLNRTLRTGDVVRDGDVWRDRDRMSVEDFGNADNLMIDACLASQGHPIVRVAAGAGEQFHDLRGFETCLQQARNEIDIRPRRRA